MSELILNPEITKQKLEMLGYSFTIENDWAIIFKQGRKYGIVDLTQPIKTGLIKPIYESVGVCKHFITGRYYEGDSRGYAHLRTHIYVRTKGKVSIRRINIKQLIAPDNESEILLIKSESGNRYLLNKYGKHIRIPNYNIFSRTDLAINDKGNYVVYQSNFSYIGTNGIQNDKVALLEVDVNLNKIAENGV